MPYTKHGNSKRKPTKIARFYRSDEWHLARAVKICACNGRCEKCGSEVTEVHHKIYLTLDNVDNPRISLNQDNLMLLCKDCHNKEHHRFGNKTGYSFDAAGNLIHTANGK